jgi:hypothetical protein
MFFRKHSEDTDAPEAPSHSEWQTVSFHAVPSASQQSSEQVT